jgi:hypothetical protein
LGKAAKHKIVRERDATQGIRKWITLAYRSVAATVIVLSIGCQLSLAATASLEESRTYSLEEACGKTSSPGLAELVALANGSPTIPTSASTTIFSDLRNGFSDSGSSKSLNDTIGSLNAVSQSFPSAPETNDPVELLTNQILQRQLELQKLNTQFRIETALVSRWRQRRVFLYAETGAVTTGTSLISMISARQQLLRSLKAARGFPKVPNDPVETDDTPDSNNITTATKSAPRTGGRVHGRMAAANELQLAGTTVTATGDLIELGLNFVHYCQIRHRNFAPGQYRQRVHKIALELDSLILQRQKAIAQRNQREHSSHAEPDASAQLNNQQAQFAIQQNPERDGLEACEGKMLSDLRDLAMVDYLEYHAATERFWVLQNTAFLLDFAKQSVTISGNIVSAYGNHWRRPRFTGTVGVTSVVAGAMVMLQPVVGRVSGNLSGSAARRLVSKELVNVNARTSDVFEADRKRLVTLQERASSAGIASSGLTQRMPLYAEQEKLMREMNGYFKNERKRAHGTLVENVTFASIVGPTRISNGMTGVIGGYRYFNDPAGRERMFLGSNIGYMFGTGLNILETARVQANEELRQHRAGKMHMRADQRFQARLQALDRLESAVK